MKPLSIFKFLCGVACAVLFSTATPAGHSYAGPNCAAPSDYVRPNCAAPSGYAGPNCAAPSDYAGPTCAAPGGYAAPNCATPNNYAGPNCAKPRDYVRRNNFTPSRNDYTRSYNNTPAYDHTPSRSYLQYYSFMPSYSYTPAYNYMPAYSFTPAFYTPMHNYISVPRRDSRSAAPPATSAGPPSTKPCADSGTTTSAAEYIARQGRIQSNLDGIQLTLAELKKLYPIQERPGPRRDDGRIDLPSENKKELQKLAYRLKNDINDEETAKKLAGMYDTIASLIGSEDGLNDSAEIEKETTQRRGKILKDDTVSKKWKPWTNEIDKRLENINTPESFKNAYEAIARGLKTP